MIFNEIIMEESSAEPIIITTASSWVCPKDGVYYIEAHGGGGGGCGNISAAHVENSRAQSGGSGGGSGECFAKRLYTGDTIEVVQIGKGGEGSLIEAAIEGSWNLNYGDPGTNTILKINGTSYTIDGGKGGTSSLYTTGVAAGSGSLGMPGNPGQLSPNWSIAPQGGKGGSIFENFTYGDGGNGAPISTKNRLTDTRGSTGHDGAVIIFLLNIK